MRPRLPVDIAMLEPGPSERAEAVTVRQRRGPVRVDTPPRMETLETELPSGTTCGKWTVLREIGVGGSAVVYEAVHRNGLRGALKVLKRELADNDVARDRLLREACIANSVDHPGVVDVLDDDFTAEGLPFLVLELLRGQSLESLLNESQRGTLDPLETCRIGIAVLDVLSAVHAAGIVHRDIKPDNIFVCTDGSVKLLDFGIARSRRVQSAHKTLFGVAMGTPGYMPSEQASGSWDEVDGRADVWAVGAVLFKALTGRYVHDSETAQAEVLAAMTQPAPKIRTLHPGIPAPLADVVDTALEMRAKDRWQSATAMKRALEEAFATLRARATDPVPLRETLPEIPTQPMPIVRAPRPRSARYASGRGSAMYVASIVALMIGLFAGSAGAARWLGSTPVAAHTDGAPESTAADEIATGAAVVVAPAPHVEREPSTPGTTEAGSDGRDDRTAAVEPKPRAWSAPRAMRKHLAPMRAKVSSPKGADSAPAKYVISDIHGDRE